MKQAYYLTYFNAITEGLHKTVYFKNAVPVDGEPFFAAVKDRLIKLRESKRKLFFFGNGASAAFANHMALDFSKNGKIPAKSLSDSALLTALSNDYSYDSAMVEFLKIEDVSKDDMVITISSSGNSPNIVNVLQFCKENNIPTLALSGLKESNKSIAIANYSIYVPMKTYGIVECLHQVFLHSILDESMDIFEWDRTDYQDMNAQNFKL
jgi:D-sedoheptulose 7-phosphate isomerase